MHATVDARASGLACRVCTAVVCGVFVQEKSMFRLQLKSTRYLLCKRRLFRYLRRAYYRSSPVVRECGQGTGGARYYAGKEILAK